MRIIHKITQRTEPSISKYFNELKSKPLTFEEEKTLFNEYKINNNLIAREKLIKSNLRFVISCAKNYQSNSSKLSLEDIIGFGNIGLVNAIERYDPNKGFKFISYAVYHIKQQIILALQKNNNLLSVPNHHTEIINKVTKEIDLFHNINQRNPLSEELVEYGYVNEHEVSVYTYSLNHKHIIGFDDVVRGGNDSSEITYNDLIGDKNESQLDKYIEKEELHYIYKTLLNKSNLNYEEKLIIKYRFGIGCEVRSMEKIANDLNFTIKKTKTYYDLAMMKMKRKNNYFDLLK